MGPSEAGPLYERFVQLVKEAYPRTSQGIFGSTCDVMLVNDGMLRFLSLLGRRHARLDVACLGSGS